MSHDPFPESVVNALIDCCSLLCHLIRVKEDIVIDTLWVTMDWTPELSGQGGTVSGRLLTALRHDIIEGRLASGAKLPPHRELAHRLGIGIGTVTAAYAEAARQGLITATVGRGSFVADHTPAVTRGGGPIALDRNVPPLAAAQRRFAAAMARIARRADLGDHLGYAPPAGLPSHRRSAAAWLGRIGGLRGIDPDRLIMTEGGQQAMSLAFEALCRPGDAIMTEAASYFGIKSIVQAGGYRAIGLKMDAEGLLPDALDEAALGGARVLYTLPTLQNPTGRIMGARRRAEIVAVARRRDIIIVEDDVYAAYAAGNAPAPLAALAPERCFYVGSASKALAPGLRTGFLIVPGPDEVERVLRLVRGRVYAPSVLGALVTCQWIDEGIADEIVTENGAEALARGKMAAARLGAAISAPADPRCPHIWLPMSELDAERLAARAMRAGVELTPPSAPLIDASLISGVRLCLGAPADRAELGTALDRVAAALDAESHAPAAAVV